jgi:hypothetical protein
MADWRFLRKPEFWITTIIAILLAFIGGFMYSSIENPSFNVQNSSRIAINYKSSNSPITITETKLIPGSCGGNTYNKND